MIGEGLALMAIYLGPFFGLLALGALVSDVILPRCPRVLRLLERWLQIDLGDD